MYYTENLTEADAIFVDDYCHTVTWTAKEQSEEEYRDGFDPRAQLIEGHKRLLEHPRHVLKKRFIDAMIHRELNDDCRIASAAATRRAMAASSS